MKRSKKNNSGIIVGGILSLCQWIATAFCNGGIYKLLTASTVSERLVENSAVIGLVSQKAANNHSWSRTFKRNVAKQFEESFLIRKLSQFFSALLSLPIRVYGSFFLTWSIYAVLIALIKRFLLNTTESVDSDIVCGVCVLLFSLPLLFSGKSLRRLCGESVMMSRLLVSVLGISEEAFREEKTYKGGNSIAVILGILFGISTYAVSPIGFLVLLFGVVLLALVFIYPEVGVVITIAISPFLGVVENSSITVAMMVAITAASFFIKYIRGKRILRFGITELATIAFMCAIFLSGFAPSEANTMNSAVLLLALMLIYFLIDSLFRYKRWINIGVAVLIAPATVIAFVGIVGHLLGHSPSGWLDSELYSAISGRAVSLFENPNILGVYLAMMLPLAISLMLPHNNRSIRFAGFVSSLFIIVCAVFTYSRSAWIGLLVGAFVFVISVSPKYALLVLPAGAATVLGVLAFPSTFGARILNFFSLGDSANSYRVSVWNSVSQMLRGCLGGGIGAGDEAFSTAYLNYAAPGTESVVHSHSLYLQIVLQFGVVGLILFAIAVFLIIQKSYSSAATGNAENNMRYISKACVSGALALLASGIFDYTWYNRRLFLLFWVLLGLAVASVNVRNSEYENSEYQTQSTADCAELTVSVSPDGQITTSTEDEEK